MPPPRKVDLIIFDMQSPERGWLPFVEWLKREQVFDWLVKKIVLDANSLMAEVTCARLNAEGKRYIDPHTNQMAVTRKIHNFQSHPPVRRERRSQPDA